ncbi:MAG: hypothetical protein JW993_14170 [Sedimentisphaerales bacterium]|nr:hypothetical protein [Sedimentisphaerales bacterium]
MMLDVLQFAMRTLLAAAVFGFVWTLIKPRTQSMRIVRAALLVLCLLLALTAVRAAGI